MSSTAPPHPETLLPVELRLLIASHVDWQSFLTLRLVSRTWHDITTTVLSSRIYRSSAAITFNPGELSTIHHAEHENGLTKRLKASFRNIQHDLNLPRQCDEDPWNRATIKYAADFIAARDRNVDWENNDCEDSDDEHNGVLQYWKPDHYGFAEQQYRRLSPIKKGVKVHKLLSLLWIPIPEEDCMPILHPDCFLQSRDDGGGSGGKGGVCYGDDPLFKPAVIGPIPLRVRYKYSYPPEHYPPHDDDDYDGSHPGGLYARDMMDYEYCHYTFVISPSSSSTTKNILTVNDFVTQFESNMRNAFKWEERVSVTGFKPYVNPNGWLDVYLVVEERYNVWDLEDFEPQEGERFHLHNERPINQGPMNNTFREAFCDECDNTSEAGVSDTEVHGEFVVAAAAVAEKEEADNKMNIDEADDECEDHDEDMVFEEDVDEEYAIGVKERTSEPPYGHMPWYEDGPAIDNFTAGTMLRAYRDTFVEGFPVEGCVWGGRSTNLY